MKCCPKCGRSYTDDVVFCYEDGTSLSSSLGEQFFHKSNQTTLTVSDEESVSPPSLPTVTIPGISSSSAVQQPRKNSLLWIIGTLAVIFFVFLMGLAGVGFYLLNWDSNANSSASRTSANESLNQPSTNKKGENPANKDELTNDDGFVNSNVNSNADKDDEDFVNSNLSIPQNNKSTESEEVELDKAEEGKEEEILSDVRGDKEEREELIDKPVDLRGLKSSNLNFLDSLRLLGKFHEDF